MLQSVVVHIKKNVRNSCGELETGWQLFHLCTAGQSWPEVGVNVKLSVLEHNRNYHDTASPQFSTVGGLELSENELW